MFQGINNNNNNIALIMHVGEMLNVTTKGITNVLKNGPQEKSLNISVFES